jgi:hypothetical protein
MKNKLQEYFCIYLDILGYSNRLEDLNDKELKTEFDNFIKCVVTENSFLEEFGKIIPYKIKLFSDNIFIALPVTKETINDFHLTLKHILDYQKSLIESNYFIRGGITKGILYVDEKIIWGKALVDAVKIEKDAVYPFISISKDIISLFIENDLLSDVNEFLDVPIIEIIEGKYFLDYLQTTIHLQNGEPKTYYTFLQNHRYLVKYNLANSKGKIFEKYNLLAKYHNEFCNYHKEVFPQMQRFRIKDSFNDDMIFKRKFLKVLINTA